MKKFKNNKNFFIQVRDPIFFKKIIIEIFIYRNYIELKIYALSNYFSFFKNLFIYTEEHQSVIYFPTFTNIFLTIYQCEIFRDFELKPLGIFIKKKRKNH